MNNGPIPPHERTWRHPSEIAAAQRADVHATPPGRDAQRLALGAGACVAALVLVAMFATFSTQKTTLTAAVHGSVPTIAAPRSERSVGSLPGEPVSISRGADARRSLQDVDPCVATPVESGLLAIVTTRCLEIASEADSTSTFASSATDTTTDTTTDEATGQVKILVTLPDQSEQVAHLVGVDTSGSLNGLSVVRLSDQVEPIVVAQSGLSSAESFALIGSRHMDFSLAELIELPLPDGTAILDQNGELVAISTEGTNDIGALISINRSTFNPVVDQLLSVPLEASASSATATMGSLPLYGAVAYGTTPPG